MSFEGVEKIVHTFFHKKHEENDNVQVLTEEELLIVEKDKIKSTIITDFILSLEIIMIALGTVTGQPLIEQIMVVSIVAIIATIGVYGIVALMVRMDDMGMKFIEMARGKSKFVKSSFVIMGKGLVYSLPKLIQLLAVVGTIAMLLVGGGLFVHNIQEIHDMLHALPIIIAELLMGLIVGFVAFILVEAFKKIKEALKSKEN